MSQSRSAQDQGRRSFLTGAAVAATGAAALGFPSVAKAQGPSTMRWQSTWPQKDIFHEYALDFAKKVITKADDFKGLKYRTVGISIDVFQGLGAAVNALPGAEIVPAIDRGLLDAAEFNNATSDRILGFADVSKICMLQSYHQNAEQLEITFNKAKFDALPDKMKAIIENAVEAASADMSWKAIDRYSKDYIELQTKDKVRFYRTPDSVLQKQLEVYDQVA